MVCYVFLAQGYLAPCGAVTDDYAATVEWWLATENRNNIKTCCSATCITMNRTWSHPELNPGLKRWKPASSQLSCGPTKNVLRKLRTKLSGQNTHVYRRKNSTVSRTWSVCFNWNPLKGSGAKHAEKKWTKEQIDRRYLTVMRSFYASSANYLKPDVLMK
jgi:hypothetical protein